MHAYGLYTVISIQSVLQAREHAQARDAQARDAQAREHASSMLSWLKHASMLKRTSALKARSQQVQTCLSML
jgi:hypothetical protein